MKKDFDSFPYYSDKKYCFNCGTPLSNKPLVNLEQESKYRFVHKGKCPKCHFGYHVVTKIIIGADGAVLLADYDSTETFVTSSGILARNKSWDRDALVDANKAKNFNLKVAIAKEKDRQEECAKNTLHARAL